MKLAKIGELILGAYLFMPSVEDFATGGTTLVPSAAIGLYLVSDALGWKVF